MLYPMFWKGMGQPRDILLCTWFLSKGIYMYTSYSYKAIAKTSQRSQYFCFQAHWTFCCTYCPYFQRDKVVDTPALWQRALLCRFECTCQRNFHGYRHQSQLVVCPPSWQPWGPGCDCPDFLALFHQLYFCYISSKMLELWLFRLLGKLLGWTFPCT